MNLRLGMLRFVRSLSADRSERRRLGAAVVRLLRQRRHSVWALGPLLRIAPIGGKPKLQLWQNLTRSNASEAPCEVSAAIAHPGLCRCRVPCRDRNGFLQRGKDYAYLRQRWCSSS